MSCCRRGLLGMRCSMVSPPLAMLRHCLPETPSLRATDLSLNDNQILRLAHILCVDEATIRRTTFTDIARSSRCLIATDAIQSCSTCCPAKTEPRAILRSQLLGWRITCALCGDLLQSPSGVSCASTFGHYSATALIGERLLHDEASRKARTWVSPARIAQLLLMRRVKNPTFGNYEPWRYRVLGALIPDLDDVVDRQSLPMSSCPILPLHLRPALLAAIAMVERSGPEMLEMLCGQMRGETAPCHAVNRDHRGSSVNSLVMEPGAVSLYRWLDGPTGLISDVLPIGDFAGPWPFD